jgi:hypothetical protein
MRVTWRLLVGVGLLSVPFSGCLWRPALNSTCTPILEEQLALHLESRGDRIHLIRDAAFAEELAIRHADVTRGQKSGHFVSFAVYHATREACMDRLFDQVSRQHGLPIADVRAAVRQRILSSDLLVFGSYLLFFTLIVSAHVPLLTGRFVCDGMGVWLVAVTLVALGFGLIGSFGGAVWTVTSEMVRLGDTHMSYRAFRGGPWPHYTATRFIACAFVVGVTALAGRLRQTRSD